MRPSSGWTFTVPSVFTPGNAKSLHPNEAIAAFCELQGQFINCVVASIRLDLRRIRVTSPAIPLLRLSLGAWFEATLAYERRHLAQARSAL